MLGMRVFFMASSGIPLCTTLIRLLLQATRSPPDRPPTGTGTRARIALAPELDHPHAKLIQTSPPSPSRPLISLPLLLMLAAVALGWNLNGYRLFDPDEGRNAQVAREMAQSNHHVVPHLEGLPLLH